MPRLHAQQSANRIFVVRKNITRGCTSASRVSQTKVYQQTRVRCQSQRNAAVNSTVPFPH
ncbi:MAG: hypothetical protein ABR577_12720 [Pyrinomonadaceae bacterium]